MAEIRHNGSGGGAGSSAEDDSAGDEGNDILSKFQNRTQLKKIDEETTPLIALIPQQVEEMADEYGEKRQ